MAHRVCPWWLGYLLASPVRRWVGQDPVRILSPYVREGMVVLEPGPGMGFFTLTLARLVGATGRVIAVDVQPKMIESLKRRAAKANLLDRIDGRVTAAESMGVEDLAGKVDFTLAFAVVHELPDAGRFFAEVARASKQNARVLLAEPRGHVKQQDFAAQLKTAAAAGLTAAEHPAIHRSLTALLFKK
ncbi:MAG TPA: methyltransferase domain-containing protein [Candidatus Binatia bacterium]|nr:methyltransferase domain-containing protein [Candidatus Binatia bacterium]